MVVDVIVTTILFALCVGGMELVRRWLARGANELTPGGLALLRIVAPAPLAVPLQVLFVYVLSKPRIDMAGAVDWYVPAGMALVGAYLLCLLPIDLWGASAGAWLGSVGTPRRPRRMAFDSEFEQLFGKG